MSGDSKTGNGGDSIRPSARKSIHNHDDGTLCPFRTSAQMGRNPLDKTQERTVRARHEPALDETSLEGIDEVDNVMSKFAITPPVDYRRNSLNSPKTTDDSDSEDSKLLSKSLPATLSTNSYCSEELDALQHRLSRSRTSVHRPSYSPQTERRIKEIVGTAQTNKKRNHLFYWSLTIVAVAIFVWYSNVFSSQHEKTRKIYDKLSFYNDVQGVGDKYKISDNSILQVRSGIATIFERQDTGSFIFAYNSEKKNFNLVYFNNFINELALAAARYLRNDTKTIHHVVVDPSNLQMQTDKELMNEYLADVDKTGVMLVKELDKVPSSLAMAFHYYCDEYNPLVKRSAIFFTLNMARCSMSSDKYSHENIEKCLAKKWHKVPQENIKPLLTRVVNVVIDVTSDF